MTMHRFPAAGLGIVAAAMLLSTASAAGDKQDAPLARVVDAAIAPLMREHDVPGVAVAVSVRGERRFFNYGVASRAGGQEVTEHTIFEIGSISKAFTATLGAYAQASGALSLEDEASRYLPALGGASLGRASLRQLATYTAGGLPLQFPDEVSDSAQAMAYYAHWRPEHPAGSHRRYSNPSIGLFGHLAAASLGESFDALMQDRLFPLLGLADTYLQVPPARLPDYAQGYARDGTPTRVAPGAMDAQAYGVKTSAADLIRFVEANMGGDVPEATLRRALVDTRTAYYAVGGMMQGLGWEMYEYPAALDTLLAGNSAAMALEAHEVRDFSPPLAPRDDALVNKTGSTNGFGAYAVFVPARHTGVVILANRNYPIPDRVQAAYRILQALDAPAAARP